MKKAFLILADGSVFEGKSIGAEGKSVGETVFTTGMTGYLETLTDPSYYGQIVTQTFPLIGNYGVESADAESRKSYVRGYVVRELCDLPSNFRSEGKLDDFLKKENITGICGIDTRALTKKLRESGVMNGMIVSGEEKDILEKKGCYLEEIRSYKIKEAVESVQEENLSLEKETEVPEEKKQLRVVLLDFGAKRNIQRELEKRGVKVSVLPYNTSAEKIISLCPDGVMLSNGPGDPADNVGVIEEIKKLCDWNTSVIKKNKVVIEKNKAVIENKTKPVIEKNTSVNENKNPPVIEALEMTTTHKPIPIFGICLGHQMLALARGAKTCRLKYGHRGGNHPVKDLKSGRVFITSQNHGYAVESKSLPPFAKESFVNCNDGTCEGVTYEDIPAFSVQFHPEACGGPHDTNFLFDRFIELMKNYFPE